MWAYYYKTGNATDISMKMEMKFIVIEGIDDAAYECKACPYGYAKAGATKCHKCADDSYLDTDV